MRLLLNNTKNDALRGDVSEPPKAMIFTKP